MILIGDVLEKLREIPDGTVQTCVTSPPYWGLRDYGVAGQIGLEKTPAEYVAKMVQVFREVRRVLRDDGTLWVNLGDCYASGGGAGWQGKHGARANRTHTQRALKRRITSPGPHMKGAVQEASLRADEAGRYTPSLKSKDLVGIPWRVAFALQADGWYLRQDIIWAKPNPMPESVRDRCTKSHEYVFLLSKNGGKALIWRAKDTGEWSSTPNLKEKIFDEINREEKPRWRGFDYFYDAQAIAEPVVYGDHHTRRRSNGNRIPTGWDTGGGSHHGLIGRYKSSGNKERKPASARGVPGTNGHVNGAVAGSVPWQGTERNKRSVWTIAAQPYPEAHFATFPEEIPETCIRAGSRPGDTVLDPFAGSGTTLAVAAHFGRKYIGIELNPDYAKLIRKRLCAVIPPLFPEAV